MEISESRFKVDASRRSPGSGRLTSRGVRGKQIVSAKALASRLIHDGTYGLPAARVLATAAGAKEI